MKKKAIRIGIIFLIVIIACVFLSRTLSSVWTPKAEFLKPVPRRILRDFKLQGTVELPDARDIYWSDAVEYPMVIKAVHVNAGDTVAAGDVLFDVEAYHSVDKQLDKHFETLDALIASRLKLRETMLKRNFNFDSKKTELTFSYLEMDKDLLRLRAEITAQLKEETPLSDEEISFSKEGLEVLSQIPDLSETIMEQLAAYAQMQQTFDELVTELDTSLYGYNAHFHMAMEWIALKLEIDRLEKDISELLRIKSITQYKAENKGIIYQIDVKVGQIYRGETPLYQHSIENNPFMIVNTNGLSSEVIAPENTYTLHYDDKTFTCEMILRQIKLGALNDHIYLIPEGSFWRFAINPARIKGQMLDITSSARGSFTESGYPATVLVKKGDKNYIFVAKMEKGLWGDEYRVRLVEVQINAYNDKYVALSYWPQFD
ncbi:MAG: hypothetical protein MI740_09725, partial [Halanaerobiales bacterium]|nr:hypothetical protein [Halanaerobiales bacterium]